MHRAECPFCDHANPAGSKFCNACGGPLYLSMCPHCNALNDSKATACYKCEGALPVTETHALAAHSSASSEEPLACESAARPASSSDEQGPDESWEPDRVLLGSQPPNPAQTRLVSRLAHVLSPSATFVFVGSRWRPVVSKTLPRPRSVAAWGGIVLAAVVGLGVYAYYSQSAVEVREAPAASGPQTGAAPSVAAAADQDSAAPAVADEDKNIIQERIDREGAASARGAAVGPPPVPPQNDDMVTAAGRQPPQSAPCTEIVAALGLCSPQSVQGK